MSNLNIKDKILRETLQYLNANWLLESVGIVACCLVDGDKKVFATSYKQGTCWNHAERNAYLKFKNQYHVEPSTDAMFVITLSPCHIDLKYREEESCVMLLQQLGVRHIHFGVLDSMHVESLKTYQDAGFIASITEDSLCKNMCEKLISLFAMYDGRVNSDLKKIKIELGDDFFIRELVTM